jgi:drug/metabolite transporter (DMT)-like permease
MVVLAGLFLHERIRVSDICAIVIALVGVALISLEGLSHSSGASPLHWLEGIAALVAAAVTWAFYSLFLRLITRKQSPPALRLLLLSPTSVCWFSMSTSPHRLSSAVGSS